MDACGHRGDLALMWRSYCNLEIKSYSCHYVTANIHDMDLNQNWTFIRFYGKPHREKRWRLG